jgi:hypothetical protein
MKGLIAVLALSGAMAVAPTITNGAVLVAQATPADACRNLGGMIRGDFCVIDVVFCNAATLAADGVCVGREGELVNLDEIITGPRENTPEQPGERPRG